MSKLKEIKVKNWWLVRKWGWGYSATPTGEDAWSIEAPTSPDHEGTLKQVRQSIRSDRTYHSLKSGGTFLHSKWFYDGQPIRGIDDPAAWDSGEMRHWLDSIDQMREVGQDLADEITVIVEVE